MRRPHTTVNHTSPKTSPFPACSLMSSLPTAQDYSFDKVEEEYLSLREIILPAGARWAHLSQEEDPFESMGLCAVAHSCSKLGQSRRVQILGSNRCLFHTYSSTSEIIWFCYYSTTTSGFDRSGFKRLEGWKTKK